MVRRLAFIISLVFAVACPPPPSTPDVPCGVTSLEQAAPAIFVPQNNIQLILDGGDTCTPGVGAECAEAFDACDIGFGDVAVGEVARRSFLVRALGSFLTIHEMRITGDCADVYVEGFAARELSLVTNQTAGITLVVAPTRVGTCTAQLEIASDATNTDDFDADGRAVVTVDVVVDRVAGGVEGCAPDIACCCGGLADTSSRQPDCIDERLTCGEFESMFFAARCDFECAAREDVAWLRRSTDAFMAGPVRVERDVAVLQPDPCTIERIDPTGGVVWSTSTASLADCEDVALAGEVLIVTGDGAEVLLDASDGDELDARDNEGRTVVTARVAATGAVAATVRGDDVIVRALDAAGAPLSFFEIAGVTADAALRHFIAPLTSGDVVLAFVRTAGAPAVDVASVDGSAFSLADADAESTVLLQIDDAGLVRRAFTVQTSRVAGLAAQGESFVMCGGTQSDGAVRELAPLGDAALELATFPAARSFLLHADAVGEIVFEIDQNSNVYSACSFDTSGALLAMATSNTSFSVRIGSLERTLMSGRAVASGALLDDDAIFIVGSHGGIAGQEVQPLYPAGLTPFDSGSFVYRVPFVELGFE